MFPFFLCYLLFQGHLICLPFGTISLLTDTSPFPPCAQSLFSHTVSSGVQVTAAVPRNRNVALQGGTDTLLVGCALPKASCHALSHQWLGAYLSLSSPWGSVPSTLTLLLTTSLPAGPVRPWCIWVLPLALHSWGTEMSWAASPAWGPDAGSTQGLSTVGIWRQPKQALPRDQ